MGGPNDEAPNLGAVPLNTQRLQGIYVGSTQMLTDIMHAFDRNHRKPIIDRTFPFEEAKEALAYMGSGSHFGKIVVQVSSH
ncbi:zinc-binding dehydrogenase (plasmid) [Hymenobacter volaticus]|uniref:Zinc-binding dehydrogenase n=1 Tax=Hymenobacter volaticus TaxID=2932254 RepID=A0ABY4GDZ0_9BACT|nr:zinc-binding dehydrogenase [Hymenobacter volaticus]UOQ68977.1 zinc-binding dehydrogenase [Hymenobacter volaticus]